MVAELILSVRCRLDHPSADLLRNSALLALLRNTICPALPAWDCEAGSIESFADELRYAVSWLAEHGFKFEVLQGLADGASDYQQRLGPLRNRGALGLIESDTQPTLRGTRYTPLTIEIPATAASTQRHLHIERLLASHAKSSYPHVLR